MPPKKDSFEERLVRFQTQAWNGSSFADEQFLRDKGLYDDIQRRAVNAGWEQLLTVKSDTEVQDCCEFLASFEYIGPAEDEGFWYRHRGRRYWCTMRMFRHYFGWSADNIYAEGPYGPKDSARMWSELTGGEVFVPGESTIKHCRDPAFWYLQRMISHSYIGRYSGSEKPNMADMAMLRGLYFGRRQDYAYSLLLLE